MPAAAVILKILTNNKGKKLTKGLNEVKFFKIKEKSWTLNKGNKD